MMDEGGVPILMLSDSDLSDNERSGGDDSSENSSGPEGPVAVGNDSDNADSSSHNSDDIDVDPTTSRSSDEKEGSFAGDGASTAARLRRIRQEQSGGRGRACGDGRRRSCGRGCGGGQGRGSGRVLGGRRVRGRGRQRDEARTPAVMLVVGDESPQRMPEFTPLN